MPRKPCNARPIPDAYAKWEGDAAVLVGLATRQPGGGSAGPDQQCISVSGWMKPVQGSLVSGFRTADRPGHDGVDIAAPKGTPIHAAASGLVIRVVCNAHLRGGSPYSCDVDGHPVNVLAAAGTSSCCTPTRPSLATST